MDDNDTNGWSLPTVALVPGLESMRVIHVVSFLPDRERDTLFDTVCANRKAFQPPGGPGTIAEGSLLLSLDSDKCDLDGVGSIRAACECLSKRIEELLPTLFTALGVEPFAVPNIPLSLVHGLNGHRGVPHTDESGGRFKISLLYYFHREPKAFHGGDLEFYNADPTSPSGHRNKPLARIDHGDNLLIAFPSHTFHGITDVQCDTDDFSDGRFAVIGFLGPQ